MLNPIVLEPNRTASETAISRPIDRSSAEKTVVELYRIAGRSPPGRFVWAGSPFALAEAWADRLLGGGANLKSELLDATVGAAGRMLKPVGAGATLTLDRPSGSGSGAAIARAVEDAAEKIETRWLRRLTFRMLRTRFADSGWNPHDDERTGLAQRREQAERMRHAHAMRLLAPISALRESVGWILPHERICWLSEPARTARTDAAGRIHSATAAAVEYPDGRSLHAWKGVVVPGWMIEQPWRLTASTVDFPYNALVRRCMIDIMTPQRFVSEGGAYCLSSDETGKLWNRRWWSPMDDTWDAWAAVEVVNGTPEPDGSRRHYFLQVPPEVQSAREAVAWTYGMTERQYANLIQRT